jgi:hypothetical protein
MKLTRRRRHRWTGPNVAEGFALFAEGIAPERRERL